MPPAQPDQVQICEWHSHHSCFEPLSFGSNLFTYRNHWNKIAVLIVILINVPSGQQVSLPLGSRSFEPVTLRSPVLHTNDQFIEKKPSYKDLVTMRL